MKAPIPIELAVEDDLSAAVVRTVLERSGQPFYAGTSYIGHGFGYLRNHIRGFNNAAQGTPWFVLTDLDESECPPELVKRWLPEPKHPNLLFRVAVREVEAWLLADRAGFARFLGIRKDLIPLNADSIQDPKQHLIALASRSRRREIREDIVPPRGSVRQIGPNYNGRLVSFVRKHWDVEVAMLCSESLTRTMSSLSKFTPPWPLADAGR